MATGTTPEKSPDLPKPRKSRKLIIMLVIFLVVLGTAAAVAATFYLRSKQPAKAAVVVPADPIFVALEPFTVNLQPGGKSRFLHVAITMKVDDARTQGQIAKYLPEVRSRVLIVLSNREAETLQTPEEKTQLSADVMAALNLPFVVNLPAQAISSVMFTTFMLQ